MQAEARATVKRAESIDVPAFTDAARNGDYANWQCSLLANGRLKIGGLSYQQLDDRDYANFLDNYLRNRYDWALYDLSKIGLKDSKATSTLLYAQVIKQEVKQETQGTRMLYELAFPTSSRVDARCYPEKIYVNCLDAKDGTRAELSITLVNKPAVRLPESYWLSFNTADIVSLVAEKLGEPVDLLDVVEKGNRQMHGIDRYVDMITTKGTVRIWSRDAFLINVGEPRGLNYSTQYPDKRGGIHFNLGNNLWNTNFCMWWEGSITYHFTIEWIRPFSQ